MQHAKSEVVKNPLVSTQQLYEIEREKQVANRAKNQDVPVSMPDYASIRDCLIRKRGKTKNAINILDVEVKDTLTSDQQPFLIFDNKKRNRILIFASPTGLKILSESKKWHGDGTFQLCKVFTKYFVKSKYFAQLYTIHGYFPPAKYDQAVDKVWVKRMFPCAWILAKRRRSKDYECIIKVLRTVTTRYGYILDPDQIMIDFEIAALTLT